MNLFRTIGLLRAVYVLWAQSAEAGEVWTDRQCLSVDALSIALDMATAKYYAGREPRGYWARQVPLG